MSGRVVSDIQTIQNCISYTTRTGMGTTAV